MLQKEFYDDRGESVLVYDGIPVFGSLQGSFILTDR